MYISESASKSNLCKWPLIRKFSKNLEGKNACVAPTLL